MKSIKSTTRRRSTSRRVLIGALVLLVLTASVIGALYVTGFGPFVKTPSIEQQDSSDNREKDPSPVDVDIDDQKSDDPTSNSIKNQEGDTSSNDSDNKGMQITSAGVNGDVFRIRTLIPGVTSRGTCSLTMSKSGGTPYTASAGVQPMASSSTCKGFDVPLSSLSSGTWKILVTYTNGNTRSSSTKEVVINA